MSGLRSRATQGFWPACERSIFPARSRCLPGDDSVKPLVPLTIALGLGFAPDSGYRIYVSSESGDIVSQLAWDGAALRTIKVVPVGIMPSDIDGPHNVTVSPDGRHWYVTIAHGTPFGSFWKMAVHASTLLGRAPLETVPTTL